jgi:hypothetical protein
VHFRVTWLPHEPYPDGRLSGRTYTPGDADLPDGFPVSSDPAGAPWQPGSPARSARAFGEHRHDTELEHCVSRKQFRDPRGGPRRIRWLADELAVDAKYRLLLHL